MKESNMARADFLTSIFFVAFGIAVLIMSAQMPTYEARGINPYSAPGIVPGFLGAIIALFGLILFVRSILRKGHHLGINGRTIRNFFTAEQTARLFLTLVISVLYALVLVGRVPYAIATGVYCFVFVLLFEYKLRTPILQQWKTLLFALILAVATAASVTAVFQYLFLVNLPG
ncbi:tripartite tricarboxylate transporter TctB family protein [Salinispira pacifica]